MTGSAKEYRSTIAAVLLLSIFTALSSTIAMKKSNTWDEPAHIMAGYAYLTEGMDYLSPLNHPVAGRSLAALIPALFLELDFDPSVEPEGMAGSRFFPYSLKFLHENRTKGETVLFLSRLSNILLGAILGAYIYAWSKRLWGLNGGLLSLFIFALSPDMLAHSSLATTDLPVTTFFFITAYYLYRTAEGGIMAKWTLLAAFFSRCLWRQNTRPFSSPRSFRLHTFSPGERPGRESRSFTLLFSPSRHIFSYGACTLSAIIQRLRTTSLLTGHYLSQQPRLAFSAR